MFKQVLSSHATFPSMSWYILKLSSVTQSCSCQLLVLWLCACMYVGESFSKAWLLAVVCLCLLTKTSLSLSAPSAVWPVYPGGCSVREDASGGRVHVWHHVLLRLGPKSSQRCKYSPLLYCTHYWLLYVSNYWCDFFFLNSSHVSACGFVQHKTTI